METPNGQCNEGNDLHWEKYVKICIHPFFFETIPNVDPDCLTGWFGTCFHRPSYRNMISYDQYFEVESTKFLSWKQENKRTRLWNVHKLNESHGPNVGGGTCQKGDAACCFDVVASLSYRNCSERGLLWTNDYLEKMWSSEFWSFPFVSLSHWWLLMLVGEKSAIQCPIYNIYIYISGGFFQGSSLMRSLNSFVQPLLMKHGNAKKYHQNITDD